MNSAAMNTYYTAAFLIGAGLGAALGGVAALGPAGEIIAGVTVALLGMWGLGDAGLDFVFGLQDGYVNICAIVQGVLSVIGMWYGVRLAVEGWRLIAQGKDPWEWTSSGDDGGCTSPGCDGDEDGAGNTTAPSGRVRPDRQGVHDMAQSLADEYGVPLEELTTGRGWKFTIYGEDGKWVMVRMGVYSDYRPNPYFKVSVFGKGTLDCAGNTESLFDLVHFDLFTDSRIDVVRLIDLGFEVIDFYWPNP